MSRLLGDKPYLLGDEPCVADAALFGHLNNFLNEPLISHDIKVSFL